MPDPRTWTLAVPAGTPLLSLNDRHHWSVRGKRAKTLSEAGWALARQQKIPALARASVVAEYRPPDRRRRDHDNIPIASGKHVIDGIVQAGVLKDDCAPYVVSVTGCIGPVTPQGQLLIHITEVAGES